MRRFDLPAIAVDQSIKMLAVQPPSLASRIVAPQLPQVIVLAIGLYVVPVFRFTFACPLVLSRVESLSTKNVYKDSS